jgi:hypothetical protein
MRKRTFAFAALVVAVAGCGGGSQKGSLVAVNGVDLVVRDSAVDSSAHWRSPDIKIDAAPYARAPTTSDEFDRFADEPFTSEGNRAYVRVLNRGDEKAENVHITVYGGPATTMLPPLDETAEGWQRLEPAAVAEIAPGAAGIASFELSPLGRDQCLVVVVGSDRAPEPPLDGPGDRAVTASNSVAARNIAVTGRSFEGVIVVRNPTSAAADATVDVRAAEGVAWSLEGVDKLPIALEPGEVRNVRLSVSAKTEADSQLTVEQRLETPEVGELRGGMTYLLRP